ncbi:MAG: asparagine synthase-related protein, partial [Terriglobales bacterium]
MRFGTTIFAEWKHEKGRVEAWNDRFGFFSIFYKVTDQGISFSPQIGDLVGSGEELDYAALAVFFRIGFFLGEDTPFAKIRALPPNCLLVFEGPSRMQLSGDITLVPERAISYDRAVDTYAELFRQAIGRRLTSKKFAVPFSGGRDSRHILLELLAQGHRPEFAATILRFPPFANDDAVVAAELCKAAGIEHRVVPQTQSRFQAETRMHQITSFNSDEHEWAIALGDDLK